MVTRRVSVGANLTDDAIAPFCTLCSARQGCLQPASPPAVVGPGSAVRAGDACDCAALAGAEGKLRRGGMSVGAPHPSCRLDLSMCLHRWRLPAAWSFCEHAKPSAVNKCAAFGHLPSPPQDGGSQRSAGSFVKASTRGQGCGVRADYVRIDGPRAFPSHGPGVMPHGHARQ